jgi:pimeloyl-ACP methyl ester carboxylesterase
MNRPWVQTLWTLLFTCVVVPRPAWCQPPDQFVKANGVTLQYVDWGGSGDVVLLLPGLGDDVHRFDAFAPRFIDAFHVVGFSRRGQGASEKPASGYETETLVEDIRGFLDAMHVDRVDVIGHSIAGVEMTLFAGKYPRRVRHLVYLDAAYDMGTAYDVAVKAKLIPEAKAPSSPLDFINTEANRTHLNYQTVRAPALAFFVINERPGNPWYAPFERGYKGDQIKLFKRNMKRGEVIEFHDTDHLFFADPKKVVSVVQNVRAFLSRP